MPLQETSGNVTTDAYGGGVAAVPNYIEDVFSTYVYNGTSATNNIVNGIDLANKGGLVWTKARSVGYDHSLQDTARGAGNFLISNTTAGQVYEASTITSFNANGYTAGVDNIWYTNHSPQTYVSWTFRKQPKFFDIVTFTGNGNASSRNIAHNLGSLPGFMLVKATSQDGPWMVAAGDSSGNYRQLNLNSDISYASTAKANMATTTTFDVGYWRGNFDGAININGVTYVAYLFAHNAGGFGLTGTDNVISCGSFTASGGTATVTLGYEPAWVMIKETNAGGSWDMSDNMRGMPVTGSASKTLDADLANAESSSIYGLHTTATGFVSNGYTSGSFIYIAIRRGPMKVPTVGTSVFSPVARAGTSATATVTTNFVTDSVWSKVRNNTDGIDGAFYDRLRGVTFLVPNTNGAELSNGGLSNFANNTGYNLNSDGGTLTINSSSYNYGNWAFKRAPSFFDEVCYTGTSVSGRTVAHNLNAEPEMIIVKRRDGSRDWTVSTTSLGWTKYIQLNNTDAPITQTDIWNNTSPTSSVFTVGDSGNTNFSSWTYVAYLFATCAGVSKVGSYTGNGSTQTINCGFTSGARFVLIRRANTSITADWYVYDTARGMTVLTDPYFLMNTTAAETATLGSVTTVSTGFALNSTILAAINVSGGTYIFLAIA